MKGGKRQGAGRKPKPKIPEAVSKSTARELLDFIALEVNPHKSACRCLNCRWRRLADAADMRLRFTVEESLLNRHLGRAVHTVNHLHDKPLEVHHTVSYFEVIERARKRAAQR